MSCDKCIHTLHYWYFIVRRFHIVSSETQQPLLVTDFSFPHFANHVTPRPHYTHTSDVASVLSIHWLPFAFCHQDRMRRHLNPLPVTKATDHHCNQIPATFLCFLQQWDKVLFFHLSPTPSDHSVCGLHSLNAAGTPYIMHQCFKEFYCILLYFVEGMRFAGTRAMWLKVQVSVW